MSTVVTANPESALYEAGKKLGAFGAAAHTALGDKKITWVEGGTLGVDLISLATTIIKKRDELGVNVADGLDDQEKADFMGGFAEGYDIEDDNLEEKVETYGGYAVTALNYLLLFILAKTKKTETATEPNTNEPAAAAAAE